MWYFSDLNSKSLFSDEVEFKESELINYSQLNARKTDISLKTFLAFVSPV
jgi:hypothetical protein